MTTRRNFIRLCGAAVASPAAMSQAIAQNKGQVVVSSYGGSYQDALREAIFKPFEQETGVKVVEATGAALPKIRAMVQTGSPDWDVVDTLPGDFLRMQREGLAERLDYTKMDAKTFADFSKEYVQPYGVGTIVGASVISFNTKRISPANPPKGWADVWNVNKFPGGRALAAGSGAIPPLEYALLADGVPADKLYPLDMERAYASLTRLKSHVVKWVTTNAMAVELVTSGEAAISQNSYARIQVLKEQGAPVDSVFDQALLESYWWTVLKGAKNYANALKYIEFASRAESQAKLTKAYLAGPLNKKAIQLLPPARAKLLPTHPENLAKGIFRNAAWWAAEDGSGKSNIDKNLAMWNAWIVRG